MEGSLAAKQGHFRLILLLLRHIFFNLCNPTAIPVASGDTCRMPRGAQVRAMVFLQGPAWVRMDRALW